MTGMADRLRTRIVELQDELEIELEKARSRLNYSFEHGQVVFTNEVRRRHRAARIRLGTFLRQTRPMVVLTAPVIYGLIVPLVLLDLCVTVYQHICFRVYRIPRVARRDFIFIDRHRLAYLNGLQKLNCVYCGYVNGLIAYAHEVAGRTEAFWCPIKHAARARGTHGRYAEFLEYGDEERFLERWADLRASLRADRDA